MKNLLWNPNEIIDSDDDIDSQPEKWDGYGCGDGEI